MDQLEPSIFKKMLWTDQPTFHEIHSLIGPFFKQRDESKVKTVLGLQYH